MAQKSCEFIIKPESAEFKTKLNGDMIILNHIHLNSEQAGNLAYIINSGQDINVEIKAEIP